MSWVGSSCHVATKRADSLGFPSDRLPEAHSLCARHWRVLCGQVGTEDFACTTANVYRVGEERAYGPLAVCCQSVTYVVQQLKKYGAGKGAWAGEYLARV